jgi:hypothetical protein
MANLQVVDGEERDMKELYAEVKMGTSGGKDEG